MQIGITSIGILNGIVGESALAAPFAIWMQGIGLEQRTSEIGATALVVVVMTYFRSSPASWCPSASPS